MILQHTVYEREVTSQLNTTFKESILEICSTGPEDSGDYLCTASNEFSSTSAASPTNLTVIPGIHIMHIMPHCLCKIPLITSDHLQNLNRIKGRSSPAPDPPQRSPSPNFIIVVHYYNHSSFRKASTFKLTAYFPPPTQIPNPR